MGQSPVVEGTNELNTFQIGARSIDPSRMTAEQWLTNRQMAMISTAAVSRLGIGNVARYPLIDITNAVISRMLIGGPGPDGSDPGFQTQGAIFYEVRSVGQKQLLPGTAAKGLAVAERAGLGPAPPGSSRALAHRSTIARTRLRR
jgi:hypothetical protein